MAKTDEQLMELCQGGDLGAFKELLLRYQNKLMAFICSMMRDYHLAEDIFQETFIRVFRQSGRFKSGGSFRTWLYTIAANRCRDELRKAKRRASLPLDEMENVAQRSVRESYPESLPDKGAGPREIAKARELEKILQGSLGELSPEHRGVVVMSRLLGLKYDEIAKVLGIPSGTVRSRLHYALSHLRESYEKRAKD